MSTPGNLICSKCGFSNVPGDQFCGSCGAFLEWEGVAAAADPAPATAPPGVPVVAPPGARSSAVEAEPGPPAGTGGAGSRAVAPRPGALTRCPACGIANEPGRTFCQSCGTKLPETGGVLAASADDIAAAVAAPNQPGVVKARTPGTEPAVSAGGGGVLRWLVIVGVIGIVVGVAVVAGGSLLRGSASSAASTNPSLAVLPSRSSSGAPPASGGASGAPRSSSGPAVSVPLALQDATASSVVGDLAKFQPAKAIDGDPN